MNKNATVQTMTHMVGQAHHFDDGYLHTAPSISSMPQFMGDDNQNDDEGDKGGAGTGLLTRPETKTKKPSMYKVLMLNDDYTPMEFVIEVLQSFFRLSSEKATEVMLHVHHRGVGICGVFPLDVAETKVSQVMSYARQNQHPLQCTLEKE